MSRLPPLFTTIPQGYQVQISGTDEQGTSIDIVGTVPEQITWNLSSEWRALIDGGNAATALQAVKAPASSMLSSINNAFLLTTGYSANLPALSKLVWTSTSHLTLDLPFQFNAISNPLTEVLNPMLQLSKLQLPSVASNGLLRSPGPSIITKNPYNLTLHIGSRLTFSNIIVTNVTPTLDSMVSMATQDFISGECHVTFSTSEMMTKDTMDNIFSGVATQPTTAAESLVADFKRAATSFTSLF